MIYFLQYTRLPARNDDEEDDAEKDGGDGGDPDQAAHRLLELLEGEGDHEGEDDRQLSEHKAIYLQYDVYNWGLVELLVHRTKINCVNNTFLVKETLMLASLKL